MTAKEFYRSIRGDYAEMFARFPSEELITSFVAQFPSDSSYQELMDAIAGGNIRASFEAAHKLKGLAASLSFSLLLAPLTDLCEQLRTQPAPADPVLVQRIREIYHSILQEIYSLLEPGSGA